MVRGYILGAMELIVNSESASCNSACIESTEGSALQSEAYILLL